jgi:hypothetical protein
MLEEIDPEEKHIYPKKINMNIATLSQYRLLHTRGAPG